MSRDTQRPLAVGQSRSGACNALLAGNRLHLQHGPIDIIIGADGEQAAIAQAHAAVIERFDGLLSELVAELPLLRQSVHQQTTSAEAAAPAACPPVQGPVARAMWQAAVAVHDGAFLTPMAAVAGAVADALAIAYRRPGIRRAWLNNGGDIALVLTAGTAVRVGLYSNLARFDAGQANDGPQPDGQWTVSADMPVRGIATSGWRGRSFSLGIADSVTVLAATATLADAAATMIANAVDCNDPSIIRRPARTLKDDTDLGDLPVTVAVPPLPAHRVDAALDRGLARARMLQDAGQVAAAVLVCQGRYRVLTMPGAGPAPAWGLATGNGATPADGATLRPLQPLPPAGRAPRADTALAAGAANLDETAR